MSSRPSRAPLYSNSEDWAAVEYEDETIYLCKKKAISGKFEVGTVCNAKYKNGSKYPATILTIGSKQFCENAISVRQSQVNNTIFPQTENSEESAYGLKRELSLQVLSEESEINSSPPKERTAPFVDYPANTLKNSQDELVDASQEGLPLQAPSEKSEINSSPPKEGTAPFVDSPVNALKNSPDELVDASQEGLPLQAPSEKSEINSSPPSEEAVQLVNIPVNSIIKSPVRGNFEESLDSDVDYVPLNNSDTDPDYVPCSNSDTDIDFVPCSNSDDSDTERKLNNPLQTRLKEIRKKTKFPQLSVNVNNQTDIPVEDDSDVNCDNDTYSYVPCNRDNGDIVNTFGNSSRNLTKITPPSTNLIAETIGNTQVFRSNNKNNIRKWDKRQSCLYCGSLELKLPRHLERRHKDETEVQRFLSMEKGSKERSALLKKLRNAGNFKHNTNTLIKNSGKIIPLRRPNVDVAVEQYQPCEMCNALFKKDHLWRHRKRCSGERNEDNHHSRPGRITQPYSRMLLPVPEAASEGLKKNVLSRMNSDIVYLACRNDTTILKYGSRLYQKHGHEPHLHSYVSEKLREMGRFLLSARKTDKNIIELRDCLKPSQFNNIVAAVKDLCGFNFSTNKYSIPSLALKIGHALKKCAMIIKSDAIITQNEELKKNSELFINLCEMEWANEISSRALATLEENKWNKLQLLPFAEDLSKLHQHLIKTTKQWKRLMLNKPTSEGWKQLCEVTLAQVLLFNRKRSGEVERIKIETFENRDQTAITQTEIQESLSEFERKLSQSLTLLEVRGKRGRKVPILLTEEMKVCVELLIKHRSLTGVSATNDYIFAKSKFGSIKPIRGGDVLRKFAKECNAEHPSHITSTKLRKHVATLSQVMNLKKNELDNLASFLGHDIAVHREYYRLPQSTIYLAKVSKILLAVEKGNVQAYKGLSLDEINVDHSYISEESEDESAEECDQKLDDRGGTSELRNEDEKNKIQQGQRRNERCGKKQGAKRKEKQRKHDCSDSDSDDVTEPAAKKNKGKRIPWSKEEASAVKRHLSHRIALLKVPGKRECEECLSKEKEILKGRTWQNIKFFVYNMITTKKRQIKNSDHYA